MLALYAVTEAFLAKHLGGRYQAVGADFGGSSLKVEAGGALVPGLDQALDQARARAATRRYSARRA
jgi:hypothetical protein